MSRIQRLFILCVSLMVGMLLVGLWMWPLVTKHSFFESSSINTDIKFLVNVSATSKILVNHHYGKEDNHSHDSAGKMNFELCHFRDTSLTDSSSSNKVVVMGVTGFLGYHAAMYLQETCCDVLAIENIINLPSANDAAWMRWKSLVDHNLDPKYLNLSAAKQLNNALSKHNPSTIVFVPTPLFEGYQDNDVPLQFQLSHLAESLRNFVTLLELVQSDYQKTRIILFSESYFSDSVNSIQRSWLKCFELALSAFEGLYEIRAGIIKVDGVSGQLQSAHSSGHSINKNCHIVSDVMKTLLNGIVKSSSQCIEYELKSCGKVSTQPVNTSSKQENHPSFTSARRNTIMTTYFTGILDPQHPYYFLPDSYLLLTPYLKGAIQLGLNVVIFHNALSEKFQDRVNRYYTNIEFVKSDIKGRTPNDKRFYLFYDYLLENPDIEHVLMTDMRDVTVLNNPFDVMEGIGDQLFVGLDLPWFVDASSQGYVYTVMKMCYGINEASSFTARMHPFLNAGVVGGTRHIILSALHLLIEYLNRTHQHANCNMGAVNLVFHRFFGDRLLGGFPIQSGFKAQMPGPEGVAVKHKAKMGWS